MPRLTRCSYLSGARSACLPDALHSCSGLGDAATAAIPAKKNVLQKLPGCAKKISAQNPHYLVIQLLIVHNVERLLVYLHTALKSLVVYFVLKHVAIFLSAKTQPPIYGQKSTNVLMVIFVHTVVGSGMAHSIIADMDTIVPAQQERAILSTA